jgi:RND family efflux transporter MFP subunit
LTQSTTDSAVSTQIRQQEANVASAQADLKQAEKSRSAQYESTKALLEDSQSKIEGASAAVANANAGIRSAQANLDNATAKYNRITGLYKQGFVSAQDVDDGKTALSVQQAAVEVARGQLQSATAQLNSTTMQKRSVDQQGNMTRAKADADVEAARAKLIQAKAGLEYARANAKQSPAYRQSLEALGAGVAAVQASLDSSIARQQDTVLRSPIDGVVTGRNLDPGSLATAGQPILVVQAMNKVWVSVAVPEDVCVKLHVNDPATVTLDALDGLAIPARIAQINPSADLQSRQYTVRAILDNSDNKLAAGMFARVNFITGKASHVLAVPREAVQKGKDGGNYVITPGKDRKAQFCPVVTGVSDADWIAVTGGFTPSMKVVTMSANTVREGQMLGSGGRRGGGKGRHAQAAPASK